MAYMDGCPLACSEILKGISKVGVNFSQCQHSLRAGSLSGSRGSKQRSRESKRQSHKRTDEVEPAMMTVFFSFPLRLG